jgi:sialate O-acetylesterase
MKKLLCSALLLAMTLAAQAEVKLPKIFGDNMVLQQQTECNLWARCYGAEEWERF